MLRGHELPLRATSVGGFSLYSLHILRGLGRLLHIQATGSPEHCPAGPLPLSWELSFSVPTATSFFFVCSQASFNP